MWLSGNSFQKVEWVWVVPQTLNSQWATLMSNLYCLYTVIANQFARNYVSSSIHKVYICRILFFKLLLPSPITPCNRDRLPNCTCHRPGHNWDPSDRYIPSPLRHLSQIWHRIWISGTKADAGNCLDPGIRLCHARAESPSTKNKPNKNFYISVKLKIFVSSYAPAALRCCQQHAHFHHHSSHSRWPADGCFSTCWRVWLALPVPPDCHLVAQKCRRRHIC